MIRRLMHHFIDGYGTDPAHHASSSTRPSCGSCPSPTRTATTSRSPTATGCGARTCATTTATAQITVGDGVDLNRNFPTNWGYDNEGSSPDPASETYRGTGPGLRARDAGARRPARAGQVRVPRQLPLGRRAAALRHRLAGRHPVARRRHLRGDGRRRRRTRPSPATTPTSPPSSTRPTARPTRTRTSTYGTLGFTPEMSTCETASDSIPDDEWLAEDCVSVFNFPDDEALIQAEFEKNLPVRARRRRVGARPGRPGLGRRPDARRLRGRHRSTSPTATRSRSP